MGEQVTTTRVSRPGDEVSGGCYWCGRKPRRLFSYSMTGRKASVGYGSWFCGAPCAEAWLGLRLPRPIHSEPSVLG